jgi:hypothetical protein
MKFLEIIVNNSSIKESKLYGPSKKASINPESGITIQNQSAYHVIKDCALLANRYLPHYIFAQYEDPFQALKGKFKKQDIEEFIKSTNSHFVNRQLLVLILDKIGKTISKEDSLPLKPTATEIELNDPYGEYGYETETQTIPTIGKDNVQILCDAFQVSS